MACFHSPACLKNRLVFFVGENSVLQWKKLSFSCLPQSQPCCSTISHLALVEHGSHKLRKTAKSGSLRCAIVQATTQPPTHISLIYQSPTAGEQSGVRQRREKGTPILTAEKGEHRSTSDRRHIISFPVLLRCKPTQAAVKHPNRHFLSMPNANCGGAERR